MPFVAKKGKQRKAAGKAGKSCPQNSNQKPPTVPRDDAVEVGQMVTMDRGGTSGGVGDDGPEMLNPVLWRNFPEELLLLVFSRLSVPDMIRLRSLSREWRRDVATVNSDINRACDEVSPSMVALVSHSSKDLFLVTICDIPKRRWQYAYHLQLRSSGRNDGRARRPHAWLAVACDGGLVCFTSLWKPTPSNRCCIVVVNLLTQVQHELPPLLCLYDTLPFIVRIKVELDTKGYQVRVASYMAGGTRVDIYDSHTRQWTNAAPPCGFVFGPFLNRFYDHKLSKSPGAYEFATRQIFLCKEIEPSTRESGIDWTVMDTVFEKDRVFMLLEETQMNVALRRMVHKGRFRIKEYHFEEQTKEMVQGKSYECPSVEELIVEELSAVCLNACDGFLLVIIHHDETQYFRLLDLSTSEWSNLPENSNSQEMHTEESVLCRAFWNVVP